ncbi:hypothetical protein ACFFSP_20565 [Persicitalea jodogahamensis]
MRTVLSFLLTKPPAIWCLSSAEPWRLGVQTPVIKEKAGEEHLSLIAPCHPTVDSMLGGKSEALKVKA